jgi:hypothetical protein
MEDGKCIFIYLSNDKSNLLFSMMIYFKKIQLIDPAKDQVETAMRKFAIKQSSSLDFKSSSTNVGTDKLFIGFEDANQIQFSRIRYFIESYLPKIIISISKSNDDNYLKMKLSIISSFIFLGATALFLFTLIISAINSDGLEPFVILGIIYCFFILTLLLEIKLTKKCIEKAIRKFDENKL